MKWHTIWPLVGKDLTLFLRNRFFALITVLGLVFYVAVYLLMPSTVDETIELGLYAPSTAALLTRSLQEEGVALKVLESEEALQQAVLDGDVVGGIALPAGVLEQMASGPKPTVRIYLRSDAPPEMVDGLVILVEGLALAWGGQLPNIQLREQMMGPDMAGAQIPPRDRMLPLLVLVVLMMETMGLASLIAEEVQTGTLRALLVTPLGVRELFFGKGLTSVLLTFGQAALLMLVVGGLKHQPLIILAALLLGTLMVTALGFLMASAGKDMLSVMGVGILVIIVLGIPAFGVMFPGTVTGWTRLIPSHYLADTVHQVANLGAGWGQVWPNLLTLLGVDALLFALGVLVLKRKLA